MSGILLFHPSPLPVPWSKSPSSLTSIKFTNLLISCLLLTFAHPSPYIRQRKFFNRSLLHLGRKFHFTTIYKTLYNLALAYHPNHLKALNSLPALDPLQILFCLECSSPVRSYPSGISLNITFLEHPISSNFSSYPVIVSAPVHLLHSTYHNLKLYICFQP